MSVVEQEELLVKVFMSGLDAADVARCACVNRQWRDAAMLCPWTKNWLVYLNKPSGPHRDLLMYDVERNKSRKVPMACGVHRILCSYHGLLVVTRYIISSGGSRITIGDPLKNKWFEVPEEVPFHVLQGAVLPNLTLFIWGPNRVALYDLKNKQWRIRVEERTNRNSGNQLATTGNTVHFIGFLDNTNTLVLTSFDSEAAHWEEKHLETRIPGNWVEGVLEPDDPDAELPLVSLLGELHEVQGDKLTRVDWFDDLKSSLKKRLGDRVSYRTFSSSEVLLWFTAASLKVKVVVYYRREKRWEEFELDGYLYQICHFTSGGTNHLKDLIS